LAAPGERPTPIAIPAQVKPASEGATRGASGPNQVARQARPKPNQARPSKANPKPEPKAEPGKRVKFDQAQNPPDLQVVVVAGEVCAVHVEELGAVVVPHVLKVDERGVAVAAADGGEEFVKQLGVGGCRFGEGSWEAEVKGWWVWG
jgi:hypothetical protein